MRRTLLISALIFACAPAPNAAALGRHLEVTVAQTAPASSDSLAHLQRAAREGGEMAIDASCVTPLVETTPGVHLVTESGFDYATL